MICKSKNNFKIFRADKLGHMAEGGISWRQFSVLYFKFGEVVEEERLEN